ncbi:ABC transporter substrate-binding protein [Pseudarthrobacter sp. fls2-241-R2A-168]|uniref:ABC transporter substrate-binding protein n=1 Tax=Pseudarthrobacter sp. fls2-241-R2A-168 TaxID=3040304 RepID=UPI002552A442|nr:ABC transporter substrate-binding protein [Pseudarthrobacter sp. fls2-241-R2A-168]
MTFKPPRDSTTTADGTHPLGPGAKRGHGWLSAVSLIAAAAILLTGCSASKAPGPSNSAELEANAQMDPSATFVWAGPTPLALADPHNTPQPTDLQFLRLAYDTLLTVGTDGSFTPQLAEKWEFTGPSTLTMTVRQGVEFSDGEPFDAEAVVANIESAKQAGPQQKASLAAITSVEAPDPSTVVFSLGEKRGAILGELASLAGMMISPKAIGNDNLLASGSAGTGPYVLTSVSPDALSFKRSETSWVKDQAGAALLKVKIVPDQQSRLNQLKSGEIDATNTDLKSFTALGPGFQKAAAADFGQIALLFNRDGVFKSGDARRAVDLAIDRAPLLKATYGEGEPNTQLFPKSHPAFVPELEHGPDVDQAKQLAASSGLAGTTVRILVYNVSTQLALAEAVAGIVGNIGAKPEIVPVEAVRASQEWSGKTYDLRIQYSAGHPDPGMLLNSLVGESSALNINGAPPASIADPLAEALNTPPSDERTETLRALAKAIAEDATVLSLMHPALQVVGRDNVVGLSPYQNGYAYLRSVGLAAK